MTTRTTPFHEVVRLFASSLGSIDAVRRLAARLADLSPECRAVATLLDHARRPLADHS